ncbi:MAG: hypothetical protein HUJ68_04550 [Clostridia bacterium]|nr:hypothetical protein [Clostridia bacterium]
MLLKGIFVALEILFVVYYCISANRLENVIYQNKLRNRNSFFNFDDKPANLIPEKPAKIGVLFSFILICVNTVIMTLIFVL